MPSDSATAIAEADADTRSGSPADAIWASP